MQNFCTAKTANPNPSFDLSTSVDTFRGRAMDYNSTVCGVDSSLAIFFYSTDRQTKLLTHTHTHDFY